LNNSLKEGGEIMKKYLILTALVFAVVVSLLAPQAVYARGEDSDNSCPPLAAVARENLKRLIPEIWEEILIPVNPPAAPQAWLPLPNGK